MEKFTKNRLFVAMIYLLLLLAILYIFLLIKPLIMNVYVFLRAVLAPFLIAMIISYMLNPIVRLLNERKVPRTVAVLLIYAVFITSVTVIMLNLIPMFMKQLKELNEHMPQLTMKAQNWYDGINRNKLLPDSIREGINRSLINMENQISRSVSKFVNEIGSTLNMLFVAFIIPFLAFYMLKDYQLIEKTALAVVPQAHRKKTIRLLIDIDTALGNYIRGQLLVCLIVGILSYIGYRLIGMPYPLLLASLVAIFNIIPYLGPFFGAAPAILMASTISMKMVLMVVIVNMVVQILEGNVVSPQVVGRTLHMHPLMIIFALLVGGELAGVIGLILAVPLFAVMKVILQHVYRFYIERTPA
ncbi:AI-2E family transporter [Ferviditalea candida]|uniref:AI-2E family transporter n=1 Tax=Ferviditalea candida TaxID=3108399 RepID=A0ABU5ZHL0_9BACL|nr:AI-2E family transporter [Paenibacillaceae bacterium T2]